MFQPTDISWGLHKALSLIAQVPVDRGVNTAEDAALAFSGPKFFMALIAGLVLAFAIQLLLTNLSVAIGISALGHQGDSNSDSNHESGNFGGTIRKIGTGLGLWTLVTVTISLLIACYLAVKLSLLHDWGLGAILGLVIWGAYFSLLVWASSTTVGSLVGSIVNTATSGFQAIVGTATAALGAKAVNQQVVATAEAAAAAVRREIGSAIDPVSMRESLEDYLEKLRPPELDIKSIRGEFEKLLNTPELKAIAPENLRSIDRQKFVELVSNNTSLSKKDVKRIVDQLESVWKQLVNQQSSGKRDYMGELVDYLKSAKPDELRKEIGGKLDQLIGAVGESGSQDDKSGASPVQSAFSTILGIVMGRTDLSHLDVETVLGQVQTAKDKLTQQTGKLGSAIKAGGTPTFSPIRADVENYLLNTYSWQMTPENMVQDFRNVIYDPEANPKIVRQQLEQLHRSDFVQMLQQRGVFTQDKINETADRLEGIRKEVLVTVQKAEEAEKAKELQQRVENYLRFTPKQELTSESIERDYKTWLDEPDADYETLKGRLGRFDRPTLMQLLRARQDINDAEAEQLVGSLTSVRDQILTEAQQQEQEAKSQAEALWLKLESYLRNTGKDELNPQAIAQDLRTFLENPQLGARMVQARLSRFDRDTLVKLLAQRSEISQEQANQIIDQVQNTWNSVAQAPQDVAGKAKDQYDKLLTTIGDYLRNTGKQELNPEGIKRDLTQLLSNPKAGTIAIRDRLSHVDRDTLVKLLSQRQDLNEEQVNQIINHVQDTVGSIARAPRRLAERTQTKVHDFQTTLGEYLRNTGKDELNPDSIQRDIQLLLHDPKAGMESLGDRLSRIDRDTLIKLLSQRSDISEQDANRIVDQVLSVRDRFTQQIQQVQQKIQGVIDGVFAKIRDYLNSLNRPELNYEGIKHDVRTLFDDPQAGFDALRDRLGHFNRDTLVAIISSREDISEADANRIIDQIERGRDSVLGRAERLQNDAQRRLEEVKHQAQKSAEETRKAAATASWWLFGTAFTSAVFSALGGALAVSNLVR